MLRGLFFHHLEIIEGKEVSEMLLVNYDLMNYDDDYQALAAEIRSLGTATRVLFSTWVLKTTMTASQVRDYLRNSSAIDSDDKILVVEVSDWAAYNLDRDDVRVMQSAVV